MKNSIKLIKRLMSLRLSQLMAFRFSFLSAFFVDGSLFITQLVMFKTIYSNVDTISGWSIGEVTIFLGTFSLINALNMLIYFFGVIGIPTKIKNGELDLYITKPGSSLLRLSLEKINFGSAPLIALSILIIIYGISLYEWKITLEKYISYSILVVMMTVLYYDIEVIIRASSFFMSSYTGFVRLEELLEMNMKVPGILYKGALKILFYLVLPYGIIATVPTQVLTNTISPIGVGYSFIICVAFTIMTLWIWRIGLKYYNSVSS